MWSGSSPRPLCWAWTTENSCKRWSTATRPPATGLDITDLAVSSQELQQVLLGDILSQDVTLPGKQEYRVRTQRLLIGGNLVGVVQVGEGTERASRPTERLESILL